MYRITLTILNPLTGESTVITKQFDPAVMTQVKWNGAYAQVKAAMDALVVSSGPNEPATW
jgi:hypothetical protein